MNALWRPPRAAPRWLLPLLFPLLLLAACAPPGRGFLGPAAQSPSAAALPQAAARYGRVAYVTIPAGTPPAAYAGPLASAVGAAVSRKPQVVFDVVAAVPQTGTPLDQIAAAEGLSPEAVAVARAIRQQGVPDQRITLGALVLPGLPAAQIRVYVR
ncbi:hypothetical protein [Acidisoma sp. C75]